MQKEEYAETLSEGSFWLAVLGGMVLGLEGLSGFAGKQINPVALLRPSYSAVADGIYLLVGIAALHQAYFGYSSFKKLLKFENPWEE